MRLAALLLAVALPALPAVEGVVNNVTTGKPEAGATVTLIHLGQGMQTVASVKSDTAGKFRIDANLEAGSPYLLQGLHQGVTYNRMIPPGSASTAIDLPVYNASAKAPDAKVTQHMILLEPSGTDLAVSETIIYTNSGNITLNSPEGTLRFFVPAAVKEPVRVMVQGPQGMPVPRPAEKTKEPNVWAVKSPIKPGETRIDLSYSMPATSPATFSSKILHGGGPVRIVVPKGVSLEGSAVQNAGVHPQTQATIYEVTGNEYSVKVQGSGSLRATAQPQGEAAGASSGDETSPGIEAVKPIIYRRLPWILSLGFAMLAIGFVILYRQGAPAPVSKTKKAR